MSVLKMKNVILVGPNKKMEPAMWLFGVLPLRLMSFPWYKWRNLSLEIKTHGRFVITDFCRNISFQNLGKVQKQQHRLKPWYGNKSDNLWLSAAEICIFDVVFRQGWCVSLGWPWSALAGPVWPWLACSGKPGRCGSFEGVSFLA